MSDEDLLLGAQNGASVSPHGGRDGGSFLGLFYEGHVPIREDSTLCPNHISKVPPSNTIAFGIRISTYEFGRGTQTSRAEPSSGLGLGGT